MRLLAQLDEGDFFARVFGDIPGEYLNTKNCVHLYRVGMGLRVVFWEGW